MSDAERSREANLPLVRAWMDTIGEPSWWDLMHEDIVVEFPYGPSLGQPDRHVGKTAVVGYIKALLDRAGQLKFHDLQILGTTDPSLFVCEYRSNRTNKGGTPYIQIYINKVRVQDGKVILMREFWDPKRIADAYSGAAK